ncbi:MAG: biotin--[acetyl-CoA-carboxylase] ligase [Chthoniobacterales bacterium]|nr:biotin--[acetyl-CoA-carboxylase] ligase [Chthoniobacterales bacterium]
MSVPDPLDAERLRTAVAHQQIGHCILVLQETTSTNDVVAQVAPKSAEGLVVIAEQQTAGRGQYGRRWESVPGKGLWLSILLRPRLSVSDSSRLTDFLAHAIAATVRQQFGLKPSIKPPNDVYIGHRKIAGVLVEMRVELPGSYCAIAGIGINVNHALADFPEELRDNAGSLATATGRSIDRTAFAIELLRNLEQRYAAAQL